MNSTSISSLLMEPLGLEGVKRLISWAEHEGWNPGPFDADVFYNSDPFGFYGYYFDNVLIGGGAIVSYGDHFGFMGLFIVHHDKIFGVTSFELG